jgi:hypothetical protein
MKAIHEITEVQPAALTSSFDKFFYWGLIAAILPFLFISAFIHPTAYDDFQNALRVLHKGEFLYMYDLYVEWTGRYTLCLLEAYLNPLLFQDWLVGVKIFPVILLLGFIGAFTLFFKALFQETSGYRTAFKATLVFFSLYLFSVPKINELFYWFAGAATYTFGPLLFVLYCYFLLKFEAAKSAWKRYFNFLLAIIAIVGVIGSNESILMACLVFNFYLAIWAFYEKNENRYFYLFLFFIVLAASCFSIFAPGNFARSAGVSTGESVFAVSRLLKAVIKSVMFTGLTVASWANNLVLILATILAFRPAKNLLKRNVLLQRLVRINPVILAIASLLFLMSQAFFSYLGTGDLEPRIWGAIYIFFLFTWFLNFLCLINYFDRFEGFGFFNRKLLKASLLVIMFFSISGNTNQAYLDLLFRAPDYNKNYLARYELIKNSQQKDLEVPPIFEGEYSYPRTIFVKDINPDPKDFLNVRAAEYFGLKSIKLIQEKADQ